MTTNYVIHEQTYNIQGCMGTGVLGLLRVQVWVRVWIQPFLIIGDRSTWVCQTLFLIILLYL